MHRAVRIPPFRMTQHDLWAALQIPRSAFRLDFVPAASICGLSLYLSIDADMLISLCRGRLLAAELPAPPAAFVRVGRRTPRKVREGWVEEGAGPGEGPFEGSALNASLSSSRSSMSSSSSLVPWVSVGAMAEK